MEFEPPPNAEKIKSPMSQNPNEEWMEWCVAIGTLLREIGTLLFGIAIVILTAWWIR